MRTSPCFFLAIAACLPAGAWGADEPQPEGTWHYVVPKPGEPFEHPPPVAIVLGEQKPDLVKTEPSYRGKRVLYGLLRYGTPNSPQIPLVIDDAGGDDFDLYVDSSRNGDFAGKHLVAGEKRIRRAPVVSEISYVEQAPDQYPRQILLRRDVTGKMLGVATLGYLEGSVPVGGKSIACRRVDGDANGLFADVRDRIWLDLNADGKWDAFSEQFPFQSVLQIEGKRFAIRSDQAGTRLSLAEITGVGTIRVRLNLPQPAPRIRALEVALMGEDGSAHAARSDGEAIQVPEGRYAVRALKVSLERGENATPWNFVFSRYDTPKEEQWRPVKQGQEVVLDPIGSLRFVLEGNDLEKMLEPGKDFAIQPRLYTQDGLLINSCDFNETAVSVSYDSKQNHADVALCQTDGTVVATYKSGFA